MLITALNSELFELNNIIIKDHEIKKCNKIPCIRDKIGNPSLMFGNIIQANNNILFYYRPYQGFNKNNFDGIIRLMISKDGINFKILKEPLLKNIGSIPNNVIITKYNNKYIGIGGRHCEKETQENHNNINCICKNTNYHSRIVPPFKLNYHPNFYNNGHGTLPFINPNMHHKCYMNGLYLLESDDGLEWKLKKNKPIISGIDDGMVDRIFGATTFDSQGSLLFNKKNNKYYFYCRENYRVNVRSIRYSTSSDLINWDKWELINEPLFDFSKDNYYNSNFFTYPDSNFFLGLLPFNNNNFTSLSILTSMNAVDWTRKQDLLKKKLGNYCISYCPAHNGLILSPDKKEFYIYVSLGENNGDWYRYSIRKDGFKSFINTNNSIGILKLKKNIIINDKLILNYNTINNGYIILKIYFNNNLVFTSDKLIDDNVNKNIEIPNNILKKNIHLEFNIFNANLFSVKYL